MQRAAARLSHATDRHFLLGAFVGGGLMASVPSGKAHDD
jgi:hypothetical protein